MIIDGKLWAAPVINDEITAGEGRITGNFSTEEAKALVDKINATIGK